MQGGVAIKLCYKTECWPLHVPQSLTFAELKDEAAKRIGIPEQHINLLVKGRPRSDADALFMAGVKNGAKITIAETEEYRKLQAAALAAQEAARKPAPQPQRPPEPQLSPEEKAKSQIAGVRGQVDDLAAQVQQVQQELDWARAGKEAGRLAELLTQKLLKLDNIDVAGSAECRQERKNEINRINAMCDHLETFKARAAS
ncbi:hypothetical protein WJX72_001633 [[Myrmecia] bisecta]|uniref:BAG family molecular chaperone regulator 1 n=1 Tax=[Myrmecia] bisecta TaxID=41462 RepID=A0AAW1P6G6_9CHLO